MILVPLGLRRRITFNPIHGEIGDDVDLDPKRALGRKTQARLPDRTLRSKFYVVNLGLARLDPLVQRQLVTRCLGDRIFDPDPRNFDCFGGHAGPLPGALFCLSLATCDGRGQHHQA